MFKSKAILNNSQEMLEWLFGKKKEPEKQKRKEPQGDEAWQFQFLLQFLSSPIWKVSILDFVDSHCLVFDCEEENKFEYTIIHKKFKELVATLVDGMIQQIGMDEDTLAILIERGFESKHQKLFNQLLLCDDFLKFKKLMVARNKTLEAAAMKAIAEGEGSYQSASKPNPENKPKQEIDSIRSTKKQIEEQEEEMLRRALEESQREANELEIFHSMHKVVQNIQIEKPTEEKEEVKVKEEPVEVKKLPEIKRKTVPPLMEPLPAIQSKVSHIQNKHSALESKPLVQQVAESPKKVEVEPEEDRRRRLIEQRERMRKKKEDERKKSLEEEGGKVETIVLQDDGIHETQIEETQTKISKQQIERRRELMRKIKNRMVDDF